MKELKELQVAGKSTFLSVIASLPADTALAMFAGNSSAMRQGVTGTITSIDYEEVGGANTPPVADVDGTGRGQVVVIGGEEIQLAKVGEKPKAPTIRFDNGITMTLGLLYQGGEKTTIHFKGDGATTKVTDLKIEDIAPKIMNKKFKCDKYWRDASNQIGRNIGSEEKTGPRRERSYSANVYEFSEI